MCFHSEIMKESEFIEARKKLEALEKNYEELTARVIYINSSKDSLKLDTKVCFDDSLACGNFKMQTVNELINSIKFCNTMR